MRRILFLQGLCEEVDDGVQDVFIKVFRAKPPAQETFLAWFYTLILNTGRDLGRRRKTRKGLLERLTEIAPAEPAAAAADDPSRTADPRLRAALAALAPDFREVVALRFFADLSLEQIAHCQGVPPVQSSRGCMALWRVCARASPRKRSTVDENDDTMNGRTNGGERGATDGEARAAAGLGSTGFDDDRLLAFALGLADDPELLAAAAGDAELGRRLDATRADVHAVSDGLNAAVPAPDDSYTDLSQERWRGLAPYLQPQRSGRQPRRPRAFLHRVLAPAVALLVIAAVLGGVFALAHHGGSSSATRSVASKGGVPGAPAAAQAVPRLTVQDALANAYATVAVARTGQVSGRQQRFTVLRTLKGTAPRSLRLRSEGSTLPAHTLTILYLGAATGAAMPTGSLGLFGGTQAPESGVQSVPAPAPVLTGRAQFGGTSPAGTNYTFDHGEVLAVPLPPGTKSGSIHLP